MSNTNSQTDLVTTDIRDRETKIERELPDDVRELAAISAAASAKAEELRKTRTLELQTKWAEEAAAIGKTPLEILTGDAPKKRGKRKPKHE